MLDIIRKHAHGLFAWSVVLLMTLMFAMFGLQGFFSKTSDQKPVATIGKTVISRADFERAYERVIRFRPPENEQELVLMKDQILKDMVLTTVLSQKAEAMGFYISDEQVHTRLMGRPEFSDNGQFSPERYHQILKHTGWDEKELKAYMKQTLLIEQLQAGLIASAFSLPNDVQSLVGLIEQSRKVGFATLSQAPFKAAVSVSEEDKQTFYQDNPAEFVIPEKLKVDYIELSQEALSTQVAVTESILKTYYDEHQSNFEQPEKRQVSHILLHDDEQYETLLDEVQQAFEAGTAFDALAKQYSVDPMSAEFGGELDWFSGDSIQGPFEEAVFETSLKTLSEPVKTDYGYHLLYVTEVTEKTIPDFSEVRHWVDQAYRSEQASMLFADKFDQMTTLLYESPESLLPVADALDLPIKTSPAFSSRGGAGIFAHPAIVQAAFSESVKHFDENSEPVALNQTTYVALHLSEHFSALTESFDSVSDRIETHLIQDKTQAQMTEKATAVMDELALADNDAAQQAILKAHQLTWNTTDWVKRHDLLEQWPEALQQAVFYWPNNEDYHQVSLENGDMAIAQLVDIKDGQLSDVPDEYHASIEVGLAQQYGELDYALLREAAFQNTDIAMTRAHRQ